MRSIVYNDHGLNFFLDKMPTFAVGAAAEYRNADEGWGLPTLAPFPGDPNLSWHVIESLVADEFDVTTCQEMLRRSRVHGAACPAVARPRPARSRTLPIAVNTVQHPLPSPARCFKLGQALGRAIASYPQDARVVVIGTGGLSHQLDGERAGFINKEFDLMCLEKIVDDPRSADALLDSRSRAAGRNARRRSHHVARRARRPRRRRVRQLHRHYHIPVSNTAAGLLLLENAA